MKPAHIGETEDCRRISEMLSRIGDKWSVLVVDWTRANMHRIDDARRRYDRQPEKV